MKNVKRMGSPVNPNVKRFVKGMGCPLDLGVKDVVRILNGEKRALFWVVSKVVLTDALKLIPTSGLVVKYSYYVREYWDIAMGCVLYQANLGRKVVENPCIHKKGVNWYSGDIYKTMYWTKIGESHCDGDIDIPVNNTFYSPETMPNVLCRLILDFTFVRVVRAHDLTRDDKALNSKEPDFFFNAEFDKRFGKGAYESNPYVVIQEFTPVLFRHPKYKAWCGDIKLPKHPVF